MSPAALRVPRSSTLSERLATAWTGHPLIALLRSGRQLALYRQFHALLRAGLPMPVIFGDLRKLHSGPTGEGLGRAAARLASGTSLADALAAAGPLFDPVTLELLRSAEQGGTLDRTLQRRIEELERMRQMALRAVFSLLYPAYLAIGLIFIGPLLDVPGALQAKTGGGAGLGASDVAGLYTAGLLRMLLKVAALGSTVFALPFLVAAANADRAWDRLRLRLPLVGPLYRSLYTARLFSVLASALASGLEVGLSVRLAVSATQSPAFSGDGGRGAADAERRIRQGGTLTDSLARLDLLDASALAPVQIGERTGELPEQLERAAGEQWESAARRTRVLALVLLGVGVAAALAWAVVKMLGVLFGTILESYRTLDNLEHS